MTREHSLDDVRQLPDLSDTMQVAILQKPFEITMGELSLPKINKDEVNQVI